MTFEQQVGDAIVGCLASGLMWLTPNEVAQFRKVLAPRVAAAIRAAVSASSCHCGTCNETLPLHLEGWTADAPLNCLKCTVGNDASDGTCYLCGTALHSGYFHG